jgi:membrane-associated progesterone receptor component
MSTSWLDTLTSTPLLVAGILGISVAIIANRRTPEQVVQQTKEVTQAAAHADSAKAKMAQSVSVSRMKPRGHQEGVELNNQSASVMSAPATNLAPPKVRSDRPKCADPQNDPISLAQLAAYDGKDPSKPIYVAIKGKVFDVSAKKEMYGPGAGYNIFAGKDASKGLG